MEIRTLAIIDLRGVFDSMERNIIRKCLHEMEVLVKLIQEMKNTYKNVIGMAQIAKENSEEFEWKTGFKHE